MFDVAIVGAGPAGLAAGCSLACEGRSVVLLDAASAVGGQIAHSHLVENVVGYSQGFSGEQFAGEAHEQALHLGVTILLGQQVMIIDGVAGKFTLMTPETRVHARAVLLALGVSPRPLPFDVVPGTCTCTSDLHLQPAGPGEHVVVYGGGNSAGQAACYYAKCGCRVTLLSRRPLQETMDARWIATLTQLGVEQFMGEVRGVHQDTVIFESSGVVQVLLPHTLHGFLGGTPTTAWLDGVVELDAGGYIITDDHHCTSTYGVYAAGDCVAGSVKRFTCAVGGGVEAVHALDASMLLGV